MTEREKWMRQISAYGFAAWELHIFLDTHPDNCDAAKKLEEAQKKQKALVEKFEAKYGPINETSRSANRWAWVTGPWPWEQEANE
ncbi:MAG: spore coat protein CotJB [Oscillospiraceae bacterium]|nr:spore coat protein CotJB [Oscillospiraceae bacterium]